MTPFYEGVLVGIVLGVVIILGILHFTGGLKD